MILRTTMYHTRHGTTLPYKAAVINLWPTLFTTGLITYLGCEYSVNWGGSERVSGTVCVYVMRVSAPCKCR